MNANKQNIAVVGAGISGMCAAYALSKNHDVTLFEQASRAGGHADTVRAQASDAVVDVDMGFIVLNDRTYPSFTKLLQQLGIVPVRSDMSFGVSRHIDGHQLEYAGHVKGLFARPGQFFDMRYLKMLRDLVRLYRAGQRDAVHAHEFSKMTLGDYVARLGLGPEVVTYHLAPMVAAIWSTPHQHVMDFPARAFLDFYRHHGLFHFVDRPTWYTIKNGSKCYVEKLLPLVGKFRASCPVEAVTRTSEGRVVVRAGGVSVPFDKVVLALHADQIPKILGNSMTKDEEKLFGGVSYSSNRAVLHRDQALMPQNKNCWSSWNVLQWGNDQGVSLTYWMNKLQPLKTKDNFFVTLNPTSEPFEIIRETTYRHPLMNVAMDRLQAGLSSLQGVGNIYYCGAWCGYGFHEDGAEAGLSVAARMGSAPDWWRGITSASSSRVNIGS